MVASRPPEIRELVLQQFSQMHAGDAGIQGEAVLIRGGQYCGHRYQGVGVSAVWFLEEDQIKFYDESGKLFRVICPAEVHSLLATHFAKAA